jgi:hypothetical protein
MKEVSVTEPRIFNREMVSAAKGRIQTRIMNADGVVREHKWQRNLILDSGLDKIAYMPWSCAFQWCVSGTGTTPTKVETASTASQSGSTVTIDGGSFQFTPSHVGKLIYWEGPNVEARVTGFLTSQTVTVNVSQTVSTASFVIYNVDQTTLVTPWSMSMRYQTGDGFCGTTLSGNTVKLLRTFDFYMELTSVLITEIGFKEGPAVVPLFSRIVLAEPLYLSPGQWLQVSYELTLRLEPQSNTPKSPTITGWPIAPAVTTAGNEKIQLYGVGVIDTNGVTHPLDAGMLANEPYAPGTRFLGPGYGYINRWTNGAGSPIEIYSHQGLNPFVNPREMAGKYLASSSRNYIPNGQNGNAQWWNALYPAILTNARTDCMTPLQQPPLYSNNTSDNPLAWNGVDPYTNFPATVPNYGLTPWANWTDNVPVLGTVAVGGSSVFISENGSVAAALGSCVDRSTPRNVEIPLVLEPYTTKTFTRVKKATFLTNVANGSNWRTIGVGGTDDQVSVAPRVNAARYNSYVFVFNEAQTKLNTHELHVFFRWTWRRDFS